jgi:two-component system, CAI-1 autoinducer sensor kinase/phosphatase CqsS
MHSMRHLRPTINKVLVRTWRSYTNFHEYAEYKIRNASVIGVFSFPLFYFVWTMLVPQKYESISFRLIGSGLCLLLALADYWPASLRHLRVALSYITFVYCLPFFFSYMMLMNEGSTVWLLSMLTALMYLVFLIDARNVLPATLIGTSLGSIAFLSAAGHPPFATTLYTAIPIFMFAFLGMLLLSQSTDRIVDEKLKAASTLAGYIAHEMRTPLASIRLNAQTIDSMVVVLSDAYIFARANGFSGSQIRPEKIEFLKSSCDHIVAQSNSANAVIDALLMNLSETSRNGRTTDTWAVNSMRDIIDKVLSDNLLKYERKTKISLFDDTDFNFRGSQDLIRHVAFNLLRNAVRAAEETGGSVKIRLVKAADWNCLVVSDDGPGIDPKALNYLFTPFRTFNRDSGGSGLGLAFCRLVIENIGGTIHCDSKQGKGATFTVRLPSLDVPGYKAPYHAESHPVA